MQKMVVIAAMLMVAGLAFGQTVEDYRVDPVLTNLFESAVWQEYEPDPNPELDDPTMPVRSWYSFRRARIERAVRLLGESAELDMGPDAVYAFLKGEIDLDTMTPRVVAFLPPEKPNNYRTVSSIDPSNIDSMINFRSGTKQDGSRWGSPRGSAIFASRAWDNYQLIVEQGAPIAGGEVVSETTYRLYRFLYRGYAPGELHEFMSGVQAYVRRWMRDNGISIVVQPDGTNPVATHMQPIIDAVNAPMMTGLEDAVAAAGGPTISVDRSMQPELEALRDEVWYGDKPADTENLNAIRFLLGTAGFNQWVADYNEGR